MADTLDLESLTMAEIETIEDLTDKPMSALFPQGAMTSAGLRGAYFVLKRRSEPGLSWDDTASLTIAEIDAGLSTTSDPPTVAAD